jgi:hypothetical protein
MAADPNLQPGKSINIATQGVSSGNPITIATDGFIIPIIGDLVIGGSAIITYVPNVGFVYEASGGLIIDGSGNISRAWHIAPIGGLTIGGTADIDVTVEPVIGGIVVTGGSAGVNVGLTVVPVGGITIGGTADNNLLFNTFITGGINVSGNADNTVCWVVDPIGGINTGGAADTTTTGESGFGRGGARIPPMRRQPITVFEPPIYNPDDYLQPVDYLKRIQNVLDKAEREKQELHNYISKGKVTVTGRGKIVVIYRDQPDGEIIVANNPPLEPIVLELPHVFNKGATAREIAELEDHLILNDIFGLGNYNIKKGPKSRYIHHSKKPTGGAADVKFIGGSHVKLETQVEKTQRREDDEFMLEVNMRTQQDREEEELRMLGIID